MTTRVLQPRLTAWSLAFAATLGLAPGATLAADISWATGPGFGGALGHQGILTNGTLVEAVDLVGQGGTPIVVDPSGLNIAFSRINSPYFTQSFFAGNGGNTDAGWAAVISSAEWNPNFQVTAAAFLSGLNVGRAYQLQLFTARAPGCCGRSFWFGDGAGNLSTPVRENSYISVVGTFTADAATQTLEFFDTTRNPYLNAYVLRDVTAPVPEPGTWALLATGLAMLPGLARRRRGG